MNALVIIKRKGKDGMRVPLESIDEVTFGRDETCNIRIAKKAVSSQHTRIFFDSNGLVRARYAAARAARSV